MTAALPVCPCCGYDLERAQPVEDGRYSFVPNGGAFVDGKRLQLDPSRTMILGAIMRARGRILSYDALLGVIGFEDRTSNVVAVHICHIRRAYAAAGAPCPIENIWGQGYRWVTTEETNRLAQA